MKTVALRRQFGFTAIELLVVVALAAVLLVVATPGFMSYQKNSELTSATNTLVAGISAARGEAMKRGRYAMLVPASGTNWNSGWVAFVDQDRSGDLDAGDITVAEHPALASYFTVSGQGTAADATPYVLFDASGYAKTKTAGFGALTITLERNDISDSAQASEQTRRIVVAKTGRVRTCKPASDATCTADAEE